MRRAAMPLNAPTECLNERIQHFTAFDAPLAGLASAARRVAHKARGHRALPWFNARHAVVILQPTDDVADLHIRLQRGFPGPMEGWKRFQDRIRAGAVLGLAGIQRIFGMPESRADPHPDECQLREEGRVPARDIAPGFSGCRGVPRPREFRRLVCFLRRVLRAAACDCLAVSACCPATYVPLPGIGLVPRIARGLLERRGPVRWPARYRVDVSLPDLLPSFRAARTISLSHGAQSHDAGDRAGAWRADSGAGTQLA